MPTKTIELRGVYKDLEIIQMENGKTLKWSNLIEDNNAPSIPFGTKMEITITYNDTDFLNGSNGIVWATYNSFQADTIKNALLVQNIFSEIKTTNLEDKCIYLIFIENPAEIEKVIDFIWREEAGLRLKLDWYYSLNQENKSFNKWLSST